MVRRQNPRKRSIVSVSHATTNGNIIMHIAPAMNAIMRFASLFILFTTSSLVRYLPAALISSSIFIVVRIECVGYPTALLMIDLMAPAISLTNFILPANMRLLFAKNGTRKLAENKLCGRCRRMRVDCFLSKAAVVGGGVVSLFLLERTLCVFMRRYPRP